jgi:NAD(P)H-hydrate epimerase
MPAGAALVYGAAGDEASQRATGTSDLVNSLGAARPASRQALFSVRLRTEAPESGEPRVSVRAAPRDREAMRLLDSTAIREYGVPSLALMENAGFWAARELWRRLEDPKAARVAVLAGKGNNGGDGFVIARHLAWWGIGAVKVYLAGRAGQLVDDARVNYEYAAAPNVPVVEVTGRELELIAELRQADWLVDALLGTGVHGPTRGASGQLLAAAAGLGRPVLAVDTPSGLDASDGHLHGPALPATVTVSFGAPKTGFALGEGPRLVGELVVAEISLPRRITGAEVEFG